MPFVNADAIAVQRWPEDPEGHAYEAAELAASTRHELILRREAFIAETVFSHQSKRELIQEAARAGYYVALHVVMIPEDLAVARVAERVANGGHSVPETKIHERFHRLWALVSEAIPLTDLAVCYDNSRRAGPLEVARFIHGFPIGAAAWPSWTPEELATGR